MEQILSLLQPNQRYTPSVKIHGEDIAELNRQATTYKDKKIGIPHSPACIGRVKSPYDSPKHKPLLNSYVCLYFSSRQAILRGQI